MTKTELITNIQEQILDDFLDDLEISKTMNKRIHLDKFHYGHYEHYGNEEEE